MDKIRICSTGKPLSGSIAISGAKNAALPAIAATLLTAEEVVLSNIPDLKDIESISELLAQHGATIKFEGNSSLHGSMDRKLIVSAKNITNLTAPYELVRKMRASVLVLGPLLARFGSAKVSLPGGCAIGTRPINLHLEALEKMGAEIKIDAGYVEAHAPHGLHGAEIFFDMVSVGATENIMMAATLAKGITILKNAAKEPEIIDLADLLNKMGAQVEGAGTDTITIHGKETLHGAAHAIIADRIEAGSFAIAAAITKGSLTLLHMNPEHLSAVLSNLEKVGVTVSKGVDFVKIDAANLNTIKPINIHTAPFPGFATDMQAQFMTLLMLADGTSHITETLFENRFMHVPELNRLSGNISINENVAIIEGVKVLKGAEVMATDLRASMSLILAGLIAYGETIINRVYHLDRGYEHLEAKLNACGANIERIA